MTAIRSDLVSRKAYAAAESVVEIRRRYEDASVVLYKERQRQLLRLTTPGTFLSYGDGAGAYRSYAYSSYGNPAVVVQRRGNNVTKADEKCIESRVCALM